MKTRKVVDLLWEDAASFGKGWGDYEEETGAYMVHSAGIELFNTKQGVTIAQSLADTDQVTNLLFVPRGILRKRKVLGTVKF